MRGRGSIFWGVALVTAGAVALAVQQGILDRETVESAWRLWPLVLIAIGLSIVLARTQLALVGTLIAAVVLGAAGGALVTVGPVNLGCGGPEPANHESVEGEFGAEASVHLEFNCGQLEVSSNAGDAWLVETFEWEEPARIAAEDDSLRVEGPQRSGWTGIGRQRWDISLPTDPLYTEINVEANAASTNLDLDGMRVTALDIGINAGSLAVDLADVEVGDLTLEVNVASATIRLHGDTRLSGSLHVNAGSLELCAPEDLALRITLTQTTAFGTNLDDSGLQQSGSTWTTANVDDVEPEAVITLNVSGNAGSFNLNPEGCQ